MRLLARAFLFSLIDMNRLEVCVAAAGRFDVSGREKMRGERDDHFGSREREKKKVNLTSDEPI